MDEKKVTNEEIVKDIERSTGMPSYWKTIVLDLIHRLQDENAEQKAKIERLSFYKTVFDKGLAVSLVNMQETIDKQKDEIERLTKWKDKLQDTKDELEQQLIDTGFKEYCEENKRLTDENSELQKQVDEVKAKIEQGTLIELPMLDEEILEDYAHRMFDSWNDITGAIHKGCSWYCEVLSVIDDIVGMVYGITKRQAEKRLKEIQE